MKNTPYTLIENNTPIPEGAHLVMLAGDTHGNPNELRNLFSEAHALGVKTIIQCGDYGFGWSTGEDGICDFSVLTSVMAEKTGIEFYWLDGNHENFDELEKLPIDRATGLRPIVNHVTHLPRGSSLTIGNTTFRAFGGAYSVDKAYRTPHRSWWVQETCTEDDVQKAIEAGSADVFLSHDAPRGVQDTAGLRRKLVEWGAEAAEMSITNQEKVRRALDASGASLAFHGHLHHSYECWIDNGTDNGVRVIGLDRDEKENNTFILVC